MRNALVIIFLLVLSHLSASMLIQAHASERVMVSLIVDGSELRHLRAQLVKLASLQKSYGVVVGDIVVLGIGTPEGQGHSRGTGRTAKGKDFTERLRAMDLQERPVFRAEELLQRYDVTRSPTWIIRYRGEDYVLEGVTSLRRYFNKRGEFLLSQERSFFSE